MWSPLARRFFRSTFVGVIVSVTTLGTVGRPVDNFVGSLRPNRCFCTKGRKGSSAHVHCAAR